MATALAAYVFSRSYGLYSSSISLLPQPVHAPVISSDEESVLAVSSQSSQTLVSRPTRPPYGQRNGWRPSTADDFGASMAKFSIHQLLTLFTGDGGSYPECHVAQYPLDMGRKKVRTR
jgi:SNW domain-containing protein 1